MNQAQNPLTPGKGYVFLDRTQPDIKTKAEAKAAERDPASTPKVALWSGHVMLENGTRVRVEMLGSTRTKAYDVTVRQLPAAEGEQANPDQWKTLGRGKLPFFGGEATMYVDGFVEISGRKYQVRMIKRQGRNGLAFNLPQVLRGKSTTENAW